MKSSNQLTNFRKLIFGNLYARIQGRSTARGYKLRYPNHRHDLLTYLYSLVDAGFNVDNDNFADYIACQYAELYKFFTFAIAAPYDLDVIKNGANAFAQQMLADPVNRHQKFSLQDVYDVTNQVDNITANDDALNIKANVKLMYDINHQHRPAKQILETEQRRHQIYDLTDLAPFKQTMDSDSLVGKNVELYVEKLEERNITFVGTNTRNQFATVTLRKRPLINGQTTQFDTEYLIDNPRNDADLRHATSLPVWVATDIVKNSHLDNRELTDSKPLKRDGDTYRELIINDDDYAITLRANVYVQVAEDGTRCYAIDKRSIKPSQYPNIKVSELKDFEAHHQQQVSKFKNLRKRDEF